MEVQVAVAKVAKYTTGESGDTVEMIERPHGGLSFVMVDGQRSGRSAKAISNLVARKAIALLAEGVRDGAAARAAHDYLFTYRGGQVQATLNILSVDMVSRTIVLSRNSHCPILVMADAGLRLLDQPSDPVGVYRGTKPLVTELPLQPATTLVQFTDGLLHAGVRYGRTFDIPGALQSLCSAESCDAQTIADQLLAQALTLDQGRPGDDITVLVLTVRAREQTAGPFPAVDVRRLALSFPLSPVRAR
jgi:serine phosphatase RsbU (regulator of sigma subunit)